LWLQADGAWRASLLDHYEAEKILCNVIKRTKLLDTPLGTAGGGRWPRGTTAADILREKNRQNRFLW
jgi:hypothetical protein